MRFIFLILSAVFFITGCNVDSSVIKTGDTNISKDINTSKNNSLFSEKKINQYLNIAKQKAKEGAAYSKVKLKEGYGFVSEKTKVGYKYVSEKVKEGAQSAKKIIKDKFDESWEEAKQHAAEKRKLSQ